MNNAKKQRQHSPWQDKDAVQSVLFYEQCSAGRGRHQPGFDHCSCINHTTACTNSRTYHQHNRFTALFPDHPGEPVPEENFWTLWCKGRLTEADTPTIRLDATLSGLTSANLHHLPTFYRQLLPAKNNSKKSAIIPVKHYLRLSNELLVITALFSRWFRTTGFHLSLLPPPVLEENLLG